MLTERPGDHRCDGSTVVRPDPTRATWTNGAGTPIPHSTTAASRLIGTIISTNEEPPVVNIRVEFDGDGPVGAHLWVTGRPLEAGDWEAVKNAIDKTITVHDAEFAPAPAPTARLSGGIAATPPPEYDSFRAADGQIVGWWATTGSASR